ncbi:MAG: ribose 5-phosphate isomerase B [Saprospiraceae bacterium]|jgi:ribose 5-phosphate isomerase B|nr:ribose 5-phosphate isomerase B [Saprospiraceae bacterium]MBK6664752.1 ribose 5-phosphate isomerase B [Saprospiraceae bacterium]MBK7698809.1 ribose 5-phosphate isomerase B [Saprospiraceae bacterium]MBK8826435.1 ribose 5-phosphate isomerase B [Saprospiraceae bacterium]MBK8885146.1 ribose 5-phosphate isomerase B [Saprospiraceae bacterium]
MKIAIGSDHAGFEYKTYAIKLLKIKGYQVQDFGTASVASVDYPDFAHPVATAVENKSVDVGILICGSGNGVCMSANKHQGIRAALCWTPELGSLARQHNDSNILCLPARFVSKVMAGKIIKAYLESSFEGGRHQNRVNKISC